MSKSRLVKKNNLAKGNRANKPCRNGCNKLMMLFYVFIFCSLAVIGSYYLIILNSKAQIGFETAELQGELNNLKETNKNLEVAVSELQQVARVQEEASKLGMISSNKVDYLSVKNSDLATR